MPTTTASSVSAALRRAGFRPAAASDRNREGLRCTNRHSGSVRVSADLDRPSEAARLSADAEQALVELGYQVTRVDEHVLTVSRTA